LWVADDRSCQASGTSREFTIAGGGALRRSLPEISRKLRLFLMLKFLP
jgi:hypothetical protein